MGTSRDSWTFIDRVEKEGLLLSGSDSCYYYLVHTPGGYTASKANSRIANFKKDPKFRGDRIVWGYKLREIEKFADDVSAFLIYGKIADIVELFGDAAIAPMPTSKPKSHPEYDDRLPALCRLVANRVGNITFEDPFDMAYEVTPSHAGGSRNVEQLKRAIVFNGISSDTNILILVDDVITTGAHFVACKEIVERFYPNIMIIGLFLSRHRSDQ